MFWIIDQILNLLMNLRDYVLRVCSTEIHAIADASRFATNLI